MKSPFDFDSGKCLETKSCKGARFLHCFSSKVLSLFFVAGWEGQVAGQCMLFD